MNVGCALLDRLTEHGIDQTDNRSVILGFQQIFRGGSEIFGNREEIHFTSDIVHQLFGFITVKLIGFGQYFIETLSLGLNNLEIKSNMSDNLQQFLLCQISGGIDNRIPVLVFPECEIVLLCIGEIDSMFDFSAVVSFFLLLGSRSRTGHVFFEGGSLLFQLLCLC